MNLWFLKHTQREIKINIYRERNTWERETERARDREAELEVARGGSHTSPTHIYFLALLTDRAWKQ